MSKMFPYPDFIGDLIRVGNDSISVSGANTSVIHSSDILLALPLNV